MFTKNTLVVNTGSEILRRVYTNIPKHNKCKWIPINHLSRGERGQVKVDLQKQKEIDEENKKIFFDED